MWVQRHSAHMHASWNIDMLQGSSLQLSYSHKLLFSPQDLISQVMHVSPQQAPPAHFTAQARISPAISLYSTTCSRSLLS
jgi:hypothetical protein